MKIVQHLRSAWQNDSFYMQTTSKNAADIFEAGVVGWITGRITRVISPRDGAIYSMADNASGIFVNFIENKFLEPLMSDKDLEKKLRFLVGIYLTNYFRISICSLIRVRGLEIFDFNFGFNKANIRFICVKLAVNVVIKNTLDLLHNLNFKARNL
ncbi:MAG: hypothetical protein M3A24_04855 [Candidatus Rhabdochlamydia oedothoracis]|nr:hypothetical protein [Candidatus Rhabdochlamydia oedothoracis]